MTSQDLVALVHLAGFLSGIVLYAMLAVMTLRGDAESMTPDGVREGYSMPLGVAALGLIWNSIALGIYALRDFGIAQPSVWLTAIGFVALGLLPAVVVHATVRRLLIGSGGRVLTIFAYVLSAVGGAFHLGAAARGTAPSRVGLLTLTIGYALILASLLALTARDRQGWRRSLFVIALAAFAVSAFHLSHDESSTSPWLVELLGHHASLPLVLVILYQDYRFAFADLFLRRALSLLALVTVAVALQVMIAGPLISTIHGMGNGDLMATIAQIALWVVTALCFPWLQRIIGHFVDRIVLGRIDYRELRERVNQRLADSHSSTHALDGMCESLALALDARRAAWRIDDIVQPAPHPIIITGIETRESALVRIPTADAPCYAVALGDFAGGRRLLSDDMALIEWVASATARRVDLLRATTERYARDTREREILQLATEAELRALRAQLNPHFLFNTLTTIGFLLRTAPDRALTTLFQLTSLLRAVLRPSDGGFVSLGEEIELIEAYLEIERARFEERLTVHIDVSAGLRALRVPPLILQPLVENAIKHGVSPLARGGTVSIVATVDPSTVNANGGAILRMTVSDTGVGFDTASQSWRRSGGLGLANVEQRLVRYYGDRGGLRVVGTPGRGTEIEVTVVVDILGADVGKARIAGSVGEARPTSLFQAAG